MAPFTRSLESSLMLSAVVVGAVVVAVVGGFELDRFSESRLPPMGPSVTDGALGLRALGLRIMAWFGREALWPACWVADEMPVRPVLSVDAADLFLGDMMASLRRVELFCGWFRCMMSVIIEEAVLS